MHGQAHGLLLKKTTYISVFGSLWIFRDNLFIYLFSNLSDTKSVL